jgi:hypothetical protein
VSQSESIKELAAALVLAQQEMGVLAKDSQGQVGTQKTKYASLEATIDVIRPTLNKNGIAYTQFPVVAAAGMVGLKTKIMHISGEWMEEEFSLPAQQTSQGHGSGLTYARRYALLAVAGIAAEDDDGAGAMPENKPATNRRTSAEKKSDAKPSTWTDKGLGDLLKTYKLTVAELALEIGEPVDRTNYGELIEKWLDTHAPANLAALVAKCSLKKERGVELPDVTAADLTPTQDVRDARQAAMV